MAVIVSMKILNTQYLLRSSCLLVLTFFTLFLPKTLFAQNDFCGLTNTSFKDGEQLRFKVYYNMGKIWVGAGEAVFTSKATTLNGKNVFHIVGDGKTLKSYEWFYKVKDKYETYIDAQAMLPLKFVRNVNEGGFRIYENVQFNHGTGKAVSTKGITNIPA